ncbi:unnamed protein product, partial [Pylaiella littoralis]
AGPRAPTASAGKRKAQGFGLEISRRRSLDRLAKQEKLRALARSKCRPFSYSTTCSLFEFRKERKSYPTGLYLCKHGFMKSLSTTLRPWMGDVGRFFVSCCPANENLLFRRRDGGGGSVWWCIG